MLHKQLIQVAAKQESNGLVLGGAGGYGCCGIGRVLGGLRGRGLLEATAQAFYREVHGSWARVAQPKTNKKLERK
jgi:hypothetical protein